MSHREGDCPLHHDMPPTDYLPPPHQNTNTGERPHQGPFAGVRADGEDRIPDYSDASAIWSRGPVCTELALN